MKDTILSFYRRAGGKSKERHLAVFCNYQLLIQSLHLPSAIAPSFIRHWSFQQLCFTRLFDFWTLLSWYFYCRLRILSILKPQWWFQLSPLGVFKVLWLFFTRNRQTLFLILRVIMNKDSDTHSPCVSHQLFNLRTTKLIIASSSLTHSWPSVLPAFLSSPGFSTSSPSAPFFCPSIHILFHPSIPLLSFSSPLFPSVPSDITTI